jgi:gamma-glutamyltranspeptidase/glutathione hydrolase
LEYIHEHYASLPWADLVYPSVKLARDGFKIQAGLANNIIKTDTGFFVDDPAWSQDFAPNGTRLGVGDIITRKRYAEVLEVIAENGPDAFYTGSIARTTVQALKKTNGTMIVKDLEDYRVIIRDSLSTAYRGYKLTTCGAPSSGTVTLQILKIIERYNDIGESSTVDLGTHRLDEAIRFGYGAVSTLSFQHFNLFVTNGAHYQRTKLGDPAFVEDLLEYQAAMLDATTIDKIIAKISDDHTLPVAAYNPDGLESIET